MRNVEMIRKEPGLVSITVGRAVYCKNCEKVSNSAWRRCGLCGSEEIVELAPLLAAHPIQGLRPRPPLPALPISQHE